MKRWEVLIDGVPAGYAEAMDSADLPKAVVSDKRFGYPQLDSRRPLSFRRDERNMHILIDTTNWRAIARHDSYKALAALAVIQFANVDTQIIRLGEGRVWAAFTGKQLTLIAASVGIDLSGASDYSESIKAVRAAMEGLEWLALPFTTEALEAQAYSLAATDDRPYGFNPEGDEPKELKAWAFDPQKGRRRMDSSYWHVFAAGLGQSVPEALAHAGTASKAPPARPSAPAPKAKKPPAAPKAPRAPSGPATRPKAGTATGKVWDLADSLWTDADAKDIKAFRQRLTAACEAEGINAGTVGVQFSKWKSSKGI